MQLRYRAEIPKKGIGPERYGSRPCLVYTFNALDAAWSPGRNPKKGKGPERYGSRPCLVRESIAVSPSGGKRKVAASVCTGSSRCPPDICIYMGPTPFLFLPNKKDHPAGWSFLFGAGYGSRTRLHGLGSRCITDIRTLRLDGIITESEGKCNSFFVEILQQEFYDPEKPTSFSQNPGFSGKIS